MMTCAKPPAWSEARFWACKSEPHLEQLLQDPLIRLMMASDGVVEADIRKLARPSARREDSLFRA